MLTEADPVEHGIGQRSWSSGGAHYDRSASRSAVAVTSRRDTADFDVAARSTASPTGSSLTGYFWVEFPQHLRGGLLGQQIRVREHRVRRQPGFRGLVADGADPRAGDG